MTVPSRPDGTTSTATAATISQPTRTQDPRRPFLFVALLVPLAAACDAPSTPSGVSVDTLAADLLVRHPAIGAPGHIQPWSNWILVSDWQGDPNLHAVNATTGELMVSFGRVGEGPGEFVGSIAGIQVPSHDRSAAWLYDMRKLVRLERPGAIASNVVTVDLTAVPQLLRVSWLDSATILGVKLQPAEERFVFFDKAGNVTRTVPGSLLGEDGIPVSQRLRASSSFSLCAHPTGRGFAMAYKHAAKVEIYDRAAEHVVDANVPNPNSPRFEDVDGGVRFVPERLHYSSCWASSEYLYVLYSGDHYGSQPLAGIGDGQEIHVFDWDTGRLVREFYLDVPVFGFSVVETAGWLYGGSLADGGVYRFRLSADR